MCLYWADLHGWMLERGSVATVSPSNCTTVLLGFSLQCLPMLQNWKMYSHGVIPQIAVTRLCCDSCVTVSFPQQNIFWEENSIYNCSWRTEHFLKLKSMEELQVWMGSGNVIHGDASSVLHDCLALAATWVNKFCPLVFSYSLQLTNFKLWEKTHTMVHCPIQEKLCSV